jgi:hypothetical protein
MKNITRPLVLLLAVAALSCVSLHAQQRNSAIGIRAGVQAAQLKNDFNNLFDNNQNRYFIGIYKDSWLVPLLRVSTGLEYYETGSRQQDVDLKLNYMSVPLAIKADLGLFNVYGGVSGAYRFGAQERIDGQEAPIPNGKYSRFDYSTFVGGGVRLLFVGIDIRHHWGKTDVYQGFQNRFWQLGATLSF